LDITLDMTAEIFLSGMDVGALADTDDSDKSDEYDQIRAMSAVDLAQQERANWPRLAAQIFVENGGARVPLSLRDVTVETGLEESQARQTTIRFTAAPLKGDKDVILYWASALGPLIVRQASSDTSSEPLYAAYLAPGEKSDVISLSSPVQVSMLDVVRRYVHSGFVHIIPRGLDHILFVLGLFLFSLSGRVLLYQISLFTLAHTITLALSSLGIVRISGQIVEPLIALSIAYVAVETIWAKGRFSWQRGLLITGFGLLHGLGFASVLADFGLPTAQFLPALISFNIGVEIGQLAIVAPLYLVFLWQRPSARFYRRVIQIPASIAIAATGFYWTAERLGWVDF
jgi:hydrogenase/urease accessory protein HupE